MKKIIFFSAIALLIFTTMSCEKEEQDKLLVDFKFRLLDTLGNEKTVFNQGENIVFSFEITNKTSQNVYIGNFFPNDDFFRVFQLNPPKRKLDYGKPYQGYIEIGYFSVKRDSVFKIQIPWKCTFWNEKYSVLVCDTNNETLPKGNFVTEFSQSFEISEIEKEHYFTEEKHFKINFTIK